MRSSFFFLCFWVTITSVSQINVGFKVKDSLNNPVKDAYLFFANKGGLTNSDGEVTFSVKKGEYILEVSHIVYKNYVSKFKIDKAAVFSIVLSENKELLQEVVVTAKEGNDITSTSIIDKRAMSHLQPSSLTDVMSLLPGKGVSSPLLSSKNNLNLRQVGLIDSEGDYATSTLGVSFLVDGLPINSNANMQNTIGANVQITPNSPGANGKRNTVRSGVDMRAIATDGIEKIEVVRGVASAKYGDLNSGLVKITRKKGMSPWDARFKSDGFSKLFHLGKGYYFHKSNLNLNFEVGYLDAVANPINSLENYKRYTASIRAEKIFDTANPITWNLNIDYTGTLDQEQRDPDVGFDNDDFYKSQYNSIRVSNTVNVDFSEGLLENINFKLGLNKSYDKIEQRRRIQLREATSAPISFEPGESYGVFLEPNYVSNLVIDGKPIDVFLDFSSKLKFKLLKTNNNLTGGLSYMFSKNNGLGQIYNPLKPPHPGSAVRSRAFKDVPAMQNLSFYLEDVLRFNINKTHVAFQAGVRANTLLGLDSKYTMNNKFYFDPRLNLKIDLPKIKFPNNKELAVSISGGYGKQSKLPTQNMLYPQDLYRDFEQLNYYHDTKEYRQIHYKTYVLPQVNYDLKPAINNKKEIRLGLKYDYHTLHATYFKESMTSGFRSANNYHSVNYRKYDASGINHNTISAAPLVQDLPFQVINAQILSKQESNGSRIDKDGVEFQYSGKRFKAINTRFTFNGAWFKSRYSNSLPYYREQKPSIIGGKEYFNIGEYQTKQNFVRELFRSSLIADTYIKSLGLTTSIRVDFTWFNRTISFPESNLPTHYINAMGERLPYTEQEQNDPILQWLVLNNSQEPFQSKDDPFSLNTHIKISKDFYRYFTMSMYVNNLLNYHKSNDNSSNATSKRNFVSPYFGMELNINF